MGIGMPANAVDQVDQVDPVDKVDKVDAASRSAFPPTPSPHHPITPSPHPTTPLPGTRCPSSFSPLLQVFHHILQELIDHLILTIVLAGFDLLKHSFMLSGEDQESPQVRVQASFRRRV